MRFVHRVWIPCVQVSQNGVPHPYWQDASLLGLGEVPGGLNCLRQASAGNLRGAAFRTIKERRSFLAGGFALLAKRFFVFFMIE